MLNRSGIIISIVIGIFLILLLFRNNGDSKESDSLCKIVQTLSQLATANFKEYRGAHIRSNDHEAWYRSKLKLNADSIYIIEDSLENLVIFCCIFKNRSLDAARKHFYSSKAELDNCLKGWHRNRFPHHSSIEDGFIYRNSDFLVELFYPSDHNTSGNNVFLKAYSETGFQK